jgi:hypothetical protein
VTLIDLSLPDGHGTEVVADLLREQPSARFIVLSIHAGSEDVYRAVKSGALGHLAKGTSMARRSSRPSAPHTPAGGTSPAPPPAPSPSASPPIS